VNSLFASFAFFGCGSAAPVSAVNIVSQKKPLSSRKHFPEIYRSSPEVVFRIFPGGFPIALP